MEITPDEKGPGRNVGGIEAEAGMLGQPVYFLTPDVVGVHMTGSIREGVTASLLFTSVGRLNSVLGPASPRVILTGRAALQRLRGKNVVLNMRLNPMLTLEPADIASYLAAQGSSASAGPTQ